MMDAIFFFLNGNNYHTKDLSLKKRSKTTDYVDARTPLTQKLQGSSFVSCFLEVEVYSIECKPPNVKAVNLPF